MWALGWFPWVCLCVSAKEGQEKWLLLVPLFPEVSLHDHRFSGTHSEMSTEPPHCVPQGLFRSLFHSCCVSEDDLPFLLSKSNRDSFHAVSQSTPLTFRTPDFKSCWLQELMRFGLSYFPSQLLWGFVVPVHSPVCQSVSCRSLQPQLLLPAPVARIHFSSKPHLCTPTFLSVAFSLALVVEFVLSVFRSISGVFRMT